VRHFTGLTPWHNTWVQRWVSLHQLTCFPSIGQRRIPHILSPVSDWVPTIAMVSTTTPDEPGETAPHHLSDLPQSELAELVKVRDVSTDSTCFQRSPHSRISSSRPPSYGLSSAHSTPPAWYPRQLKNQQAPLASTELPSWNLGRSFAFYRNCGLMGAH